LALSPRILILDEPTRCVDVGAKAEIYRLLQGLAEEGMAILLISSELPDILLLSQRILVMREGELAGELPAEGATESQILSLAMPRSVMSVARGASHRVPPVNVPPPRPTLEEEFNIDVVRFESTRLRLSAL